MESKAAKYTTTILDRCWLSKVTYELILSKPPSFDFSPGQRIHLCYGTTKREYSLVSSPADSKLILCIRLVSDGVLSPELGDIKSNTRLQFTGPHGYFTFKPSSRPAIFVATGTGVAPFCSMVRSGIVGYTLLHGVQTAEELYYADEFSSSAALYVPCLSAADQSSESYFKGRVSDYLLNQIPRDRYDFYLCGRAEMIRDITFLVDDNFPGSFIYTESFY
ncbi:MAG: FAD-binding oxidoreductase [Desulfobacterales bacterium]